MRYLSPCINKRSGEILLCFEKEHNLHCKTIDDSENRSNDRFICRLIGGKINVFYFQFYFSQYNTSLNHLNSGFSRRFWNFKELQR